MKVLITGGAPEWFEKELKDNGHEPISVPAPTYVHEQDFIKGIKDIDVYISGGIETCTANVINGSNKLKAIIFLGVDYKNYIDETAAQARGVPIFNTPGANARAVAELTLFLILAAARNSAKMLTDISQNKWKNQTGFELLGKTIGIVGSGPIAQHVASITQAMGMTALYWSRSGEKDGMIGEFKSLNEVIQTSDIVTLHVPKESGEIINKDALENMKPSSILINTSPASLVDADALADCLKNNKIATCAFDCFYAEGDEAWNCSESKLLSLGNDRFIQTPHAGWRTTEADSNMFAIALDRINEMENSVTSVSSVVKNNNA